MKIIIGDKLSIFDDNDFFDYDYNEIQNQYIDQLINIDFDNINTHKKIIKKIKNKYK